MLRVGGAGGGSSSGGGGGGSVAEVAVEAFPPGRKGSETAVASAAAGGIRASVGCVLHRLSTESSSATRRGMAGSSVPLACPRGAKVYSQTLAGCQWYLRIHQYYM